MLKRLLANNLPVIIETGYMYEGSSWLGHYQTVVGYDDLLASSMYTTRISEPAKTEPECRGLTLIRPVLGKFQPNIYRPVPARRKATYAPS